MADENTVTENATDKKDDGSSFKDNPQWRQIFMAILSAVIIGIVLVISYFEGSTLFAKGMPVSAKDSLLPYLTNTAGTLLFIMHTSRRKRARWKIREYWGEHCFRLAQSFAYLFIVLWAWPTGTETGPAGSTVVVPSVNQVPPLIIGFLVGLFVTRVERAMEGLGDKFEEALTAILPRATQYVSAEEKKRQQLRAVYRTDDMLTEYESLRPLIDDPAAQALIDDLAKKAKTAIAGDDPDAVTDAVDALGRTLETAKRSIGETLVPVETVIGELSKDRDG